MPYLTSAQIRERAPALAVVSKFPDAELDRLVAEFEEVAEEYRGTAFIPRQVTEQHPVTGGRVLLRRWPVRSVVSVLVDDQPVAAEWLTSDPSFVYPSTRSAGSVTVTYTYGTGETPPVLVTRACVEYVRSCALRDRSQVPRDVIGQSLDGGYTRFSTSDWAAGRPTGYIEVDRLLNAVPDHRVPGVA